MNSARALFLHPDLRVPEEALPLVLRLMEAVLPGGATTDEATADEMRILDVREVSSDAVTCPVCGDDTSLDSACRCPVCGTAHHQDCWRYLGRCAT